MAGVKYLKKKSCNRLGWLNISIQNHNGITIFKYVLKTNYKSKKKMSETKWLIYVGGKKNAKIIFKIIKYSSL